MIKIKKIKRRCMVNGCKNIHTFTVTRRNEFGNSIHICEDCLKDILGEVGKLKEAEAAAEIRPLNTAATEATEAKPKEAEAAAEIRPLNTAATEATEAKPKAPAKPKTSRKTVKSEE